jgi:hypothetical protein
MSDTEKRWFEVTASAEIALKVLAPDRDEAVKRFWEHDEDIDAFLMHPCCLEVTSINECEPDEGE